MERDGGRGGRAPPEAEECFAEGDLGALPEVVGVLPVEGGWEMTWATEVGLGKHNWGMAEVEEGGVGPGAGTSSFGLGRAVGWGMSTWAFMRARTLRRGLCTHVPDRQVSFVEVEGEWEIVVLCVELF